MGREFVSRVGALIERCAAPRSEQRGLSERRTATVTVVRGPGAYRFCCPWGRSEAPMLGKPRADPRWRWRRSTRGSDPKRGWDRKQSPGKSGSVNRIRALDRGPAGARVPPGTSAREKDRDRLARYRPLPGDHRRAFERRPHADRLALARVPLRLQRSHEIQHPCRRAKEPVEARLKLPAVASPASPGRRHPGAVSRPLVEPAVSRTLGPIRREGAALSPRTSSRGDARRGRGAVRVAHVGRRAGTIQNPSYPARNVSTAFHRGGLPARCARARSSSRCGTFRREGQCPRTT
jgi:hypothetical protein